MKAIIITSILTVLLSVSTLYASESNNKVLVNQETTEFGLIKEYTSLDQVTSEPLYKVVYIYNVAGELQEKISYTWAAKTGWTGSQKYEYEYNRKGQIANLIFTEWNEKLDNWSLKSQHIMHIYNGDGSFLATKKIEVNNTDDYLVSIK